MEFSPRVYEWVIPEAIASTTQMEVDKATSTPEKDTLLCSCVRWANHLNPRVPLVDATYFKTFNGGTPSIGGVVIFKYPKNYHIAIIKKFLPDGFLISEANFKECEQGEREIRFDDPRIIGFWNPAL